MLVMNPKTKNFSVETDPKLACTCTHPSCDKRAVKQQVLTMLQRVRNDYGLPMIITSGGRCPHHPNELHRDKPADHQKRQGVDIKITGLAMAMKLMGYGVKHGFNAFGISLKDKFIHMGFRPEIGDIIATWEY